jgi:hypothetical protein
MIGSFTWVFAAIAFILTTVVGFATDGLRSPFPLTFFCAILAAGVLDAGIGLAATAGAFLACTVLGTTFSLSGFTMLVILGALWCGLAVMIGKVRVFLRDSPTDLASWYRRLGDLTIGSLLCGYLGFKFIGILSGPNDSFAAIHARANTIGWAIVGVGALKYLITSFACHYYPERMRICVPLEFPTRAKPIDRVSLVLRGIAAFIVFGAFLGFNWMVVTLVILYLIDVVLPNIVQPTDAHPTFRFFIPQNLGKIFALTVVSTLATLALKDHVSSTYNLVIYALFIVMVIAIVNNTAAAKWQPRDTDRPWLLYSGGFMLALLTILQLSDHLIKT